MQIKYDTSWLKPVALDKIPNNHVFSRKADGSYPMLKLNPCAYIFNQFMNDCVCFNPYEDGILALIPKNELVYDLGPATSLEF